LGNEPAGGIVGGVTGGPMLPTGDEGVVARATGLRRRGPERGRSKPPTRWPAWWTTARTWRASWRGSERRRSGAG